MGKLIVDSSICTGCLSCVTVCSLSRSDRQDLRYSAIKVDLKLFSGLHSHSWCRQCLQAPCAKACPEGAIRINTSTGAWVVDSRSCIANGACIEACPFRAIFLEEGMEYPVKCDLCGGNPRCVEACAFGAIVFKEEND